MKKISSLLLVLVLFMSIIMTENSAYADTLHSSGSCGQNVTYTYTRNNGIGVLTIEGKGPMTDYTGLSSPDYLPERSPFYNESGINYIIIKNGVTSIGDHAFWYDTGLVSVTIPNSVTSIGEFAFENCSELSSVTIPNKVTKIGPYAFCETGLTSVKIPDSVKDLGTFAFGVCRSLTSVEMGNGVTHIGSDAFRYCTSLRSITIPDSVERIDHEAFQYCTSLSTVKLGKGLKRIGENAFQYCSNISTVCTSSLRSMYNIGFADETANPINYSRNLYYNNQLVESINVPKTVKTIPNYTFYNCSSIKSVTVGRSVESISDTAFKGCYKIDTVYLYSERLSSTQNLVSSMPGGSTLYAHSTTDAPLFCDIYGVNYVKLNNKTCASDKHDYFVTATKKATCVNKGSKSYECNICGHKYTEPIAALGHKAVVDKAVSPTFEKAGKTQGKHCSVCKKVLVAQKTVPKLVPGKTAISSVAPKHKGFVVKWKKQTKNTTGYQIQYATDAKFNKNKKTVTVKKNRITSKKISKLKANKTYFVHVRTYKSKNGKRYYSTWSKTRKVKPEK